MASAKSKVKAKAHKTKKTVDWSAAGKKAYQTRLRNLKLKKGGKVQKKAQAKKAQVKAQVKKPHVKKPVRHLKQSVGVGFGKFRVNRNALVKALSEDKRKELAPTEVVSLTWKVIKGVTDNGSGHNGKVAKRK
jgi:hypothetical protein